MSATHSANGIANTSMCMDHLFIREATIDKKVVSVLSKDSMDNALVLLEVLEEVVCRRRMNNLKLGIDLLHPLPPVSVVHLWVLYKELLVEEGLWVG